jgi:hypothetical protein
MKTKVIVAIIIAAAFAVMKLLARRKAAQDDARGGCVVCGSLNLAASGDAKACLDCGYEGRADGGGALTATEIDSLYDRERGGL